MTNPQPSFSPLAEAPAPYVMGRSAGEYERLRRQARQLEPITAPLLERVGLTEGMRCLDVGCGPGEVMRLMAERVGPRGAVTGVDLDASLGRQAQSSLHAEGHTQCTVLDGDVVTMPRPAGPRFDLVYARLVMIHADEPLALLRRMWDWTAPGGVLVIQDYDLETVGSDPRHPVMDEFLRICLGVFERAGRPLNAGTRLRRQFAAAGLGVPDGISVGGLIEPLGQARSMIEAIHRSIFPLALQWGLTTESDSAAWLAELGAAPASVSVRFPMMIGAFRRKTG